MENEKIRPEHQDTIEAATLGGGCFWCIEAAFDEIAGVINVESGYSGGNVAAPTYEQVCTGTTGHAEVVQVKFDPIIISFKEILEIFFTAHDPTTINRQGADVGSQYRSVIFYHNENQKKVAEQVINEFNTAKSWDAPIVTQIEPFEKFYKAEEYHKRYFRRHPEAAYCKIVIAPKIVKLRKKYREKLKRK
ncbi:MAG: peptide-methionine (S)-S-oxide reductase MsrA [Candidatus Bathyarchaeota archaeon]|nr:peptide-methionine (S)-S-oxide reductase MsrA [Candidatus Bathyarchaeum sp.]